LAATLKIDHELDLESSLKLTKLVANGKDSKLLGFPDKELLELWEIFYKYDCSFEISMPNTNLLTDERCGALKN